MVLANYHNFLFDLDGTLIDSFGDIKLSLENSYRIVLQKDVVLSRGIIGPPLAEMIDRLTPELSPEQRQAVVKEFRNSYDNSYYEMTAEVKGATQLLSKLSGSGKKLFLVTNKSYKPTLRILAKLNLSLFDDVLSPDKFDDRRYTKSDLIKYLLDTYELEPAKTVMIGDSREDTRAAKANSVDSISILDGYDEIEALKQENPTHIAKSIAQLQNEIN